MNEKEKVIDWITSGMNYNDGINLLVELVKKVDISMYIGRERSMASKLAYEICKAAKVADHVTWKDFIRNVMESPLIVKLPVEGEDELNELTNDGSGTKLPEAVAGEEGKLRICEADGEAMEGRNFSEVKETIASKPLEEYPLVMRRVIMEYAEMFQERSQLHTVMGRLPESNTESVCAKRAELFNLIKSISDRLELLFVTQEAFAKEGIIPVESELFRPAAEPVAEVTADTTLMDEDSLKKQKKNLQSGNSKDQTILEYQSNDRTEVKKPMPNGPKRTRIELRIADRNKRIEEIEVLLLKYVGKE
jgi:hypothetical protein